MALGEIMPGLYQVSTSSASYCNRSASSYLFVLIRGRMRFFALLLRICIALPLLPKEELKQAGLTRGKVMRAGEDLEHLAGDVHLHVLLGQDAVFAVLEGVRYVLLEEVRLDRVDHLEQQVSSYETGLTL